MNQTIWKVLTGIATGAGIVFLCLWLFQTNALRKGNATLNLELIACRNAPIKIDTVHDTIVVKSEKWITPKEVKIFVHDTVVRWCQTYYEDTYDFSQQDRPGKIHYAISVKDCKAEVLFKDILAPKDVITITQKIDTCIAKLPAYRPITHYGLYGGLGINNLTQFPMIGAGGFITLKDRFGLMLGASYNAIDGKVYGNITIPVFIK